VSAYSRITEGRHYEVDAGTGCWVWVRRIDSHGYGRAAESELAHRRSYRENVGDLAPSQPLDHLCRNRRCVNPDHLEPVTARENNVRSFIARGIRPDRQTCSRGHDMGDAYVEATGRRKCRECRRTWAREWARRNKKVAS
jgi:hypothetical protein